MQESKEYVVAPRLAHHLIGILLTGGAAGACGYMAMTNTSGIVTRRTNLSPEMLNIILWFLCGAAGLLCLIFLVEAILPRIRPAAKIRLTPTEFSIPMVAKFRMQTLTASYAQITQVQVHLGAPSRLLRIRTTTGNATVSELNLCPGVFDEIHTTIVRRAQNREHQSFASTI